MTIPGLTSRCCTWAASTCRTPCPAPERGELAGADAWFAGFEAAMQRLTALLAERPLAEPVNAPDEIVAMTDKLRCQQRLRERGIATAPLLGEADGYDHPRRDARSR